MNRRHRLRNLARERRAATALEFAMIAVPFLLLSVAPFEFGRMLWIAEAIQSAAQQGARCIGVLAPGCASGGAYNPRDATNFVIAQAADWGVGITADDVSVSNAASGGVCSGMSQVSISYEFQTVVAGLLPMLANRPPLSGSACFPNQS